MKRWVFVFGAVLAVVAVTPLSWAQESHLELSGGIQYPLISQQWDMQQGLAWHLNFGYRFTPTFTLAATYENQNTTSDIPNRPDGDVAMKTWGLRSTWVLNGEQDFQLIGFVGLGQGSLDFTNPGFELPPATSNSTDILLWWEIGGGAQFGLSKHWVLRLQVSARQTEPKEPSIVLSETRFAFVPMAEIGFRF